MLLSGYLIFHLTGREICSEGIHNAQISSYNISSPRIQSYNNF